MRLWLPLVIQAARRPVSVEFKRYSFSKIAHADVALTSFMAGDVPDARLFSSFAEGLLRRATVKGRKVRAYGEMVALLWEKDLPQATVQLEVLWQQFCQKHSFSLFCAYPRAGFTGDCFESLAEICAAHTKVI